MSSSGIISQNNGKIFDEFLPNPYPYPAAPPTLAQVLQTSDDAGNQNIENLLQIQTTNVVQQDAIGGHLTIGGTNVSPGAGGDLRIQGATLKGSILAGNGTSTIGLPVGANGLVLTTNSATLTGLEWAVGGGGGGVASVGAGLNIGITGTAANPIVGVLNPLTSVLNLAGQNITGTTSAIIQTDINVALSQSQLDAGGLDIFSTAAPGNTSQITFNGFTSAAAGSGDTMVLSPTSLTKSFGTTQMGITNAVAAQNIAINTATTGIITTNCAIKPTAIRDSASSDGTSGQYLTAGAGASTLWATLPTSVSSVSAGTNISLTGTSTAPVVNLKAPLTSTLNMGAVAITDSASATGTSGQYLTAGTGGQTLWATLPTKVSSITAGNNIGITGTATVPIVSLLSPLTSTLALGTQSITGSTSNITLSSGTNQANVNGNLGFTSVVQATPTTKANLFNTGISVETSADKVLIAPTSILKTVGTTALTVGTIGSAPLNLIGGGGAADGIELAQQANAGTVLTTNLSNVKFYPDYYLSNQNLNTVSVPLPQMDYQRLTLNNLGLTNTNTWSNYGNAVYAGYSAFTIDGGGNYWYAEQGSGRIQVVSAAFNLLATLDLQYSGNPGTINCFYQQGGFMWIGGIFSSVQDANGVNATPQFSITRIDAGTYLCDPTYDGANSIYGAFPGTEVYSITDVNGVIVYGGNFLNFSNGSTCNYIAQISSPYTASGSQTYTEFANGVNGNVYAIHHEAFLNYTFVGGDFTAVNVSVLPDSYNFCSYYDNNISTWFSVALNNFNNGVRVIKSAPTSVLFVAGNFGQIAGTGQNYNTYIDPATPSNWSDTTLSLGAPVDYKQSYYSGEIAVWDTAGSAFQISSSTAVWTSLSDPGGSGILTGINNNAGWKVIYNSNTYVRSHSVLPHSCEFQGTFIYDGTNYTKYTITTRNVSQQFIGDIDNSYWSIIGQGVGSFS